MVTSFFYTGFFIFQGFISSYFLSSFIEIYFWETWGLGVLTAFWTTLAGLFLGSTLVSGTVNVPVVPCPSVYFYALYVKIKILSFSDLLSSVFSFLLSFLTSIFWLLTYFLFLYRQPVFSDLDFSFLFLKWLVFSVLVFGIILFGLILKDAYK